MLKEEFIVLLYKHAIKTETYEDRIIAEIDYNSLPDFIGGDYEKRNCEEGKETES